MDIYMPYSDDNVRTAHEFAVELAFPRLVGTEGEVKAQQIISGKMKSIGNPFHIEDLKCSKFAINIAFRMIPPIGALLLLGAWCFSEPFLGFSNPIFSLIFALIGLFWLAFSSTIINKSFGRVPRIGQIYKTQNLISEITPSTPKGHLIYVAHYDSKSQFYPGLVRVILYITGLISGLLYAAQVLIGSIIILVGGYPTGFWPPGIYSFLIAFCLNFLLILNSVGNRSPGALDNATSVATVLELSKIFKNAPLQNVKLSFVITAAEELGLYGAADYVKRRRGQLDPKTTYFLNFDGIGGKNKTILLTAYGIPPKKTSSVLNKFIDEIVKEHSLKDEFRKVYLPIGAATDHVPIQAAGFEVTMLGTFIMNFHTAKDAIKSIEDKALKIAGIIGLEVGKKIDQMLVS
jgi:Peptidase family M28